jgi:sialate O-acetylesterase
MFKKIMGSLLLLMPGLLLQAQLKLPALCSNGMVLQSHQPVPIWGWATGGSTVKVEFIGKNYTTKAAADGHWKIVLPAMEAGGAYKMKISSGKQNLTLTDILVGEVWVCSGQSNMEHDLTSVIEKYPSLLADSSYASIRQFKVGTAFNFKKPETSYKSGSWLSATHENIGSFTAVGFFFARRLHERTGEAVGIINISLGGSPIEAWLPESVVKKYPKDYNVLKNYKSDALIAAIEKNDQTRAAAWEKALNSKDRGEKQGWRQLGVNSPEVNIWHSMSVPGYWADQGLGFMNGVVWLKKNVILHHEIKEKTARLVLGRMVDADSVFVNGHYVGNTTYLYPRRRYDFSSALLKQGSNTITIRLVNQSGKGGFVPDKPYALVLGKDSVSLAGRWKYQVGAVMTPAPGQTFIRWGPAGLYNGMLAPAFSYGIKGFIWYQGESNADNAAEYGGKLSALLKAVRKGWNNPGLPFLVVQLPNFMQQRHDPNKYSGWALLRQQQQTILQYPRTDMAVTIDLGEWNDVHPYNKRPVGERLFMLAEDMCYGQNQGAPMYITAHHSPIAEKATCHGDTVYIEFKSAPSLKIRSGDQRLKHFALAGAGGQYKRAQAAICHDGKTIAVYSQDIKAPKSVRYAWGDNPSRANLENMAELPAAPFELPVTK